jgi:aspartyl-tRNA(Asn)/glutamyl-tRNA(Gln) amidotransferase subunit C
VGQRQCQQENRSGETPRDAANVDRAHVAQAITSTVGYNPTARRRRGVILSITRDEVHRIAQLAHLDLSEEEYDLYARQLSSILDYVEQLDRLNTYGIEPTAHIVATSDSLRGDEVRGSIPRDDALANAPESEQGLFKVPRVLG